MIRLIIFDWDDVFSLGSTTGYYKCYHAAVSGVGVRLSPKEEQKRIKAKWGSTEKAELEELLREHPELVDRALAIYHQHLFGDTFVNCLRLAPGSRELLARLAKSYRLALASGVNARLLREKLLPHFDLPNVFSQIVTSHDIDNPAHTKPHPYIAQKIMHDQGIPPHQTILVGDAATDVRMAQAAGVEPVAVLTGHLTRAQAKGLGVTHIIERVTDLETVLKKLSST